jgi:nucleoid DNA-binding protein
MATKPKIAKASSVKPAAQSGVTAKPGKATAVMAPKSAGPRSAKPNVPAPKNTLAKSLAKPLAAAVVGQAPAKIQPVPTPNTAPSNAVKAAGTNQSSAFKKKDLIDRVMAVTGTKKKTVKEVVEATLSVLGDALSKGEMLNIPPFGKAKVSRAVEAGSGKAMTVKVRRANDNPAGKATQKQALADIDD